jgi:hypothetical protein
MRRLREGQRYRVTYRLDGQRYDRQFVGTYLGWNRTFERHDFNLRPAAGTGSLLDPDILSVAEVGVEVAHDAPGRRVHYA